MSVLIAAAILVTAPMPDVEQVDVAYEEMTEGRSDAAIAQLEASTRSAAEHPASLINLGVAYARVGDEAKARQVLERAAATGERYQLETSDGNWVDSRALARRALAALDSGTLADNAIRTAAR